MSLVTKFTTRKAKGTDFAKGNRVTLVRRLPGGREIKLASEKTRRRAVQKGMQTVGQSSVSGGSGNSGGGGVPGGGGGGPTNPNENWP